jgi:hypothetical protein
MAFFGGKGAAGASPERMKSAEYADEVVPIAHVTTCERGPRLRMQNDSLA